MSTETIEKAVRQAMRTSLSNDTIKSLARRLGCRTKPKVQFKQTDAIVEKCLNGDARTDANGVCIPRYHDNAEDCAKHSLSALGIGIRYNSRKNAVELKTDGNWDAMEDGDEAALYFEVKRRVWTSPTVLPDFTLKFGKRAEIKRQEWTLALTALAHKNQYDQFLDYLKNLPKWDGKERLDNLLPALFTCPGDQELTRFAMKSVLIGAVNRTFNPGAKHDLVVILVGKQGIGKSTLLRELLPDPELVGDNLNFAADDGRQLESLLGNVIVESSELRGTSRADIDAMKAFITRQTDQHRLAYRHNASRIKRQTVIVGTSNEQNCLPNDPTGNRRFLPIPISGQADTPQKIISGMPKQRDQLWAEAVTRHFKGEIAYLTPDQATAQNTQNATFRANNPLIEEKVLEYTEQHTPPFSLAKIIEALDIINPSVPMQREITTTLRNLGYEPKVVRDANGKNRKMWATTTA